MSHDHIIEVIICKQHASLDSIIVKSGSFRYARGSYYSCMIVVMSRNIVIVFVCSVGVVAFPFQVP